MRWGEVFAGRLAWSLLASFLFHRSARSHYEMFFPLIQQRRLSRLRQSVWETLRVSLRLIARLVAAALVIFVIMQFFVWPTYSLVSGYGARTEDGNGAAQNSAQFSASAGSASNSQSSATTTQKQSSSDYFMKSRQRQVEATYVLRIIGASIWRFLLHSLSSMRLQWSANHSVIAEIATRSFQAGIMAFWIEFSFVLTRIILSEHLSFASKVSRPASSSTGPNVISGSISSNPQSAQKAKRGNGNNGSKKVGIVRSVGGSYQSQQRHPDTLLKNVSTTLDLAEADPVAWLETLFSALEQKSSPLLSTHALFDLYHITHFLPAKRTLFYDPHLHDSSAKVAFDKFALFAAQTLDTFSSHLEKASTALEEGSSGKKSATKGKGSDFKFRLDSPLALVSSSIEWVTLQKSAFDAKIRQVFGWARPPQEKSGDFVSALRADARSSSLPKSALGLLVERAIEKSGLGALRTDKWVLNQQLSAPSLATPSGATALYHKEQALSMLLASISRLIEHSVAGEDEAGVVANSPLLLPLLLSLLRLHAALASYSSYVTIPSKMPSESEMVSQGVKVTFLNRNDSSAPARDALVPRRWLFSLQKSLDNSIYSFATSYYEHLSFFQFTQNDIDILQRYVDFVA